MADQPSISAYNEIGRTGLKHFSGTLYEEFLPELQGSRAAKVYTEMAENSPILGASLFAIESLLRGVPWAVEPASENPVDIELADFIDECRTDMSHTWEDFISEVLTMLRYGWSYFEVVYKKREGPKRKKGATSLHNDGLIGWRKFAPRAQDTLYRWRVDIDGGIRGMWQYPQPTGSIEPMTGGSSGPSGDASTNLVFIPIEKALLFRTTSTKNSPEGRSLLRNAYRPWYFGKRMEEVEAVGLERDLAGLPVAYVPAEILAVNKTPAAEATYRYIKDVVTKTKSDEQAGIIFPLTYDENGNKLYEFTLLSTGGRRSFDTGSIVTRYNQEMAMSLLADFILLGHEKVGSFALSSDKTELFAVALGAILDAIEEVLNRHAVPALLRLNGLEVGEHQPMFRHGDIEKPDLAVLIQYVQGLANAGAPLFPDLVLENHLRGLADLPSITEEERERILSQQMEQAMAQQQAMMGAMGGEDQNLPGPGGLNLQSLLGQKPMVGFPGADSGGEGGGSSSPRQPSPPNPTSSLPPRGGRPPESSSLAKAARDTVVKALADLAS
jgi:hypothetical protein